MEAARPAKLDCNFKVLVTPSFVLVSCSCCFSRCGSSVEFCGREGHVQPHKIRTSHFPIRNGSMDMSFYWRDVGYLMF